MSSSARPLEKILRAAAQEASFDPGYPVEDFLAAYHRHTPVIELSGREPGDILGAALHHRELASRRAPGTALVAVSSPNLDEHGWASAHTVVDIVTDDSPFLVDSVLAAVAGMDRDVHLVWHPLFDVRRDARGNLLQAATEIKPGGKTTVYPESWIHLEIDRESDPLERQAIADRIETVLDDVRRAVADWPLMMQTCRDLADQLAASPPAGVDSTDVSLVAVFLRWLADNHFTFLGYREYTLEVGDDGRGEIASIPDTGLGLLRQGPDESGRVEVLTQEATEVATRRELLIITKANSRSTVHRPVHLDYVAIRTFGEDGAVTGERRFIGLFASTAYTESVMRIPLVSDKVRAMLERSGYELDSHSGKELLGIVEHYPRDELFQAPVDFLLSTANSVAQMHDRGATRLFLRRDDFGRFVSALVFLPRDRYNTAVRLRMERILTEAFQGVVADYATQVGDSRFARLHYVIRVPDGGAIPDIDVAAVEQALLDATRTWEEDLGAAMRADLGEEGAASALAKYGRSFPSAYQDAFHPRVAVADMHHVEALDGPDATGRNLYQVPGAPANERRFKLYRRSPVSLTDVLPIFTHMGVEVVDERPYAIRTSDGETAHIYDLGLRVQGDRWPGATNDAARDAFHDAVGAVWEGEAESDSLGALVLRAGLSWRQIVVVRTVLLYLRQAGISFSRSYVEKAMVNNPDLARQLVELFQTRFDPAAFDDAAARAEAAAKVEKRIFEGLDGVASLDEDRIIRSCVSVVQATLRTNYFQKAADGRPKSYVSLKLDPERIPDLPAPRPKFEIWVYSPRVEGVHLRFGPVARGGLRWSDRREDFRTEILGLVKAQMVKNAVIVPTGSKGGFFAKHLPDPSVDRDAWLAEGIAAYRIFISALLDLTDNRVGDTIVPPPDVVRHDGDDPYLVVAADKGTATFSDYANDVSRSYGFWLDDAFASGGSAGYDHKAMGITARGAWESVKRHFREMGIDTQSQDFTVVGIGDMSGDVFGNGMLLSEHIRLVAAFDHRHIFIDPNPDAATSYAERARLFALPRSSWADYSTELISEGGGVFERTRKSIPISDQMREALDLPRQTVTLTPAELIHEILQAPLDLLWNGGIGTYVKASSESNADIGDRANDSIRVNGHQLRVSVVGEGGNLGLSQLGRIEAALHGVRLNTDAIDNSAGVDTSDHEVNLKILLSQMVRDGDLTLKQRNVLLESMTDEVGAQVLRDNYEQNVLLGNARSQEHSMVTVHARLMDWLEQRGDLDRGLEFLPSPADLERRATEAIGLKSPEFAVLVAYVKLALKHDLLQTDLADDPYLQRDLLAYFPTAIRKTYGPAVAQHPLRREIIVTSVANSIVNRGGISFVFRAVEETGADVEQIARAFIAAREIFGQQEFAARVEALDNVVPTALQAQMYLEFRRLMDRAARWFLTSRASLIDIEAEVQRYQGAVHSIGSGIGQWLRGAEGRRLESRTAEYVAAGAPEDLARDVASGLDKFSLLDIVDVSTDTGLSVADVGELYFAVSEHFGIDAMLTRVSRLPRSDRWDGLARAALRDDLYAVTEALTLSVIAHAQAQNEPDLSGALGDWLTANEGSLRRARSSLDEIASLESPHIAALSVALRTLRSVVRSGGTSVTPAAG